MTPPDDTIIAVSTPAGPAPRAVVRLSGGQAVDLAAERFEPAVDQDGKWRLTFRATPGTFRLREPSVGIPATLYVMRAPHSYTREDVVEVHVPGAPAVLDMLMDDLLAGGAGLRLAEPGEFTRRAFLNGRIDLSQAEAVLGVIRARSESELLAATGRLEGSASRRCGELLEGVTELRARIEAALDFAAHDIELIPESDAAEECLRLRRRALSCLERAREDTASDATVRVVLCGPPNAGKSTLLNRLLGTDRSITHHQAGTTRDVVQGETEIRGVRFSLSDTAGLMEAAGGPDATAVAGARRAAASCQLAVLVLDASRPLPEGLSALLPDLPTGRTICSLNKCDLGRALAPEEVLNAGLAREVVETSALTGRGVAELREGLWRSVAEGSLDAAPGDCLFNARQREAVRQAAEELERAREAVEAGMGYEFAAVNLREAAEALGRITGQSASGDVLDRIFSRFCIGK